MARVKADYPDWVLKYKKKGQYINFVKPDKYYLYAAHSERVQGTGKIKRVCDGYIGRITQKDGLILSKKKRLPEDNNVYLLEYGPVMVIWKAAEKIRAGLNRSYKEYGDWIYAMSALAYLHNGIWSDDLLSASYFSVLLKDMKRPAELSKSLCTGIERGTRMISETLKKAYGDDLAKLMAYAGTVGILKTGSRFSLTYISPEASALFEKYSIPMEIDNYA